MPNEIETFDPQTGEITMQTGDNQPMAVALARAEIDQQIATAHALPRASRRGGLRAIVNAIVDFATLSEDAAQECIYALPRGGKPIKGPSVRLAEIVAGQYGNCRVGARVVHVDRFEKYVEAEGVFHDLESNTATTARVRRRIVDKNGKLFNDDMILVTGNAAASIAKRNAILGGVPKAVWNPAYQSAHDVIAGDVKTLSVRREEAIKAFAIFGVKPEQIFAALEVGGLDDVGLDEITTLRAMFKAIKDGEQTAEEYFPAVSDAGKAVDAAKGTAAKLGKIAEQGKAATATAKKEADGKKADGGAKPKEDAPKADSKAGEATDAREGDQGGEGQTDEQAGAGGDDSAEDAGGGETVISDAEIEAAFQEGEEARKMGKPRRAMPAKYRQDGSEPLSDAWVRGFTGTEGGE